MFPYPKPVLKSTIVLEKIGEVEISTVELTPLRAFGPSRYETCLFWDAINQGDPESEVVSVCFNEISARKIHAEWCDPVKIARCIHEVYQLYIQGRNRK